MIIKRLNLGKNLFLILKFNLVYYTKKKYFIREIGLNSFHSQHIHLDYIGRTINIGRTIKLWSRKTIFQHYCVFHVVEQQQIAWSLKIELLSETGQCSVRYTYPNKCFMLL